jgi:hypothetical protein
MSNESIEVKDFWLIGAVKFGHGSTAPVREKPERAAARLEKHPLVGLVLIVTPDPQHVGRNEVTVPLSNVAGFML